MVDLTPDLGSPHRLSRTVWAVSLPILFAGISETIIRVTDTAFLARIGTIDLGAFALADTLIDVWLVPVIGFVEAMVILVGRRVGQQQTRAVRSTFRTGMSLILAASMAAAVALGLGSAVMGRFVADSPAIASAVDAYLTIGSLGLVFMALNLGYAALYTGLANTRVLVATAVIVSVTNFVGSYVLILGHLGFPQLGIRGAAWSFVIAEMVGFVYLTVHTWRHGVIKAAPGPVAAPPEGVAVRTLARLAAPVSLSALVEGARWLLFFMIMEQVSEQAVASANVVYACVATMLIATDALGDTTYSLVSNLVGRKQEHRLGLLLRRVIRSNFLISAPLVAVAIVFPDAALWVFALEGDGIANPALDLQLAAVGVLCMVPAEMWISAVAGTGDTDAAFGLEVVMSAGFVACAYWALLVVGAPPAMAWLGLAITALVSLPLAYWWVRSGRWRRRSL